MIAWTHCSYDPANAAFSYFGLGEAVAALAFTLAVPQFIKPIYRMRLAARRIRISYIFSLAFCGAGLGLIGGLLPHLPIQRNFPLAYPVIWEVAGGFLFAVAFGLLAFGSVLPLTAKKGRVRDFAQATAEFLTVADPSDHVEFAENELSKNFERLTQFANFNDWFEEPTAFFMFTHRQSIEDGEYASSLLRILSDARLCRTMVDRTPWLAADLLRTIDRNRIRCRAAERLVQEIASQAILSDDSMLEREAGYGGFSVAPVLANALFGSAFVADTYRPLQWLSFGFGDTISQPLVRRFNMAAELLLETSLGRKEFWQPSAHYAVAEMYKRMMQQLRWADPATVDIGTLVALKVGADERMKQIRVALAELTPEHRRGLYKTSDNERWGGNLIEVYADMTCELLETVSNDFAGVDDRFWGFAIGVWHTVYPFHASKAAGFDPFQQRLALRIGAKIADNMDGWYPALTRVVLAVQGPHGSPPEVRERTAYVLLGDILYTKLRTGLPRLAQKKPEKLGDFIPPSVAYDPATNTLTRTYTGGTERHTRLDSLELPEVDPFDSTNWLKADQPTH